MNNKPHLNTMLPIIKELKMNRILLIMFLSILLIGNVMALENQGVGKQGENFTFIQTCSDASYITLSTVQFPNRSVSIINTNMTSLSGGAYGYNFTNVIAGRYDIGGVSNGCTKTFATYFTITQSGMDTSVGGSIIYIAVLIILISLFILNAMIIKNLPHSNPRADSGNILSISLLKYLKPTLVVLGWGFIILILFISSNIAEAYLGHSFGNLFFTLFKLLASWQLIMLVVFLYIIYIAVNIFKDIQLKHFFDRGYSPV